MPNNVWDGQGFNQHIKDCHEEKIKNMDLPEWLNICCPFCSDELPLRSLRTLSFHLNSNEIGDISIEVSCESCGCSESVYFKYAFDSISDIINLFSKDHKKDLSECVQIRKDKLIKSRESNLLSQISNESEISFRLTGE